MILVRKKHLYILTLLFMLLVIFGEIKFFFAIRGMSKVTDLGIKYEVENFIFASIMLVLIVFFFLVNFIRTSNNVLKRMDKMIELSSYGKYDVGEHLKRLGKLGERVNYLIYHLDSLNNMKTLKISSLSQMNEFLMKRSREALFLMDRYGMITNCSEALPEKLKTGMGSFMGREFKDVFGGIDLEGLFFALERSRQAATKEGVEVRMDGREEKHKVTFYPIINAAEDVSHVIGSLE